MTPARDLGPPCTFAPGRGSVPVAVTRAMTLVMATFQEETKGRGGLRVEGRGGGRDHGDDDSI